MGNMYSPCKVAFVIAELLKEREWLDESLSREQLVAKQDVFKPSAAYWTHWEAILSVPWAAGDHINLCEAMARDPAIRLHLMDSQVNLNIAAKGRSRSWRLTHVQRRTAASFLDTGMRDINA